MEQVQYSQAQSKEAENLMIDMCKMPISNICTDTMNVGYRGDIVTVQRTESVHDACNALCDEEISSAPVVDYFKRFTGEHVSMLDFCNYYADMFKNVDSPMRFTEEYDIQRARYRDHRRRTLSTMLSERKVGTSLMNSVGINYSLYTAVEMMVKNTGTPCSSIAVLDRFNSVVGVLTPSMVIQHLEATSGRMKELLKMPVSKLEGYGDDFVTIKSSAKALEGFNLLSTAQKPCVAIVDPGTGQISDVLSQRDLKCLAPNSHNYRFLWETLDRFKAHIRERFPGETKSQKAICVSRNQTVGEVMALFNEETIHNVYVVKSAKDKSPTKCLSQIDMLRFITSAVPQTHVAMVTGSEKA